MYRAATGTASSTAHRDRGGHRTGPHEGGYHEGYCCEGQGCPGVCGADGSARHSAALVLGALTDVYERGWQPQDVLHVTGRHFSDVKAGLITSLLLAHAYRVIPLAGAPTEWSDQIHAMALAEPAADSAARRYAGAATEHGRPGCRTGDRPAGGAGSDSPALPGVGSAADRFSAGALVLLWESLPDWPHLCPPPSLWGPHSASAGPAGGAPAAGAGPRAVDPKVPARIRGLLAKAESTDFPHEAEALTAKAQELITRHAVDTALLHRATDADGFAVSARRIHLNNPYLREKVTLLSIIGRVNTVRTVWSKRLAIATVIGPEGALEQVELLYTSLLVQCTRAMQARSPGTAAPGRTAAFRRSFLVGFATRIGQRLAESHRQATRDAAADAGVRDGVLVPVLRAQDDAVHKAAQRLFPHSRPTHAGKIDPVGWCAGTDAAETATITAGGRRLPGRLPLPGA
ncbi:DUF2786 domain-containing protein [Tomitella cavernea]|uniref:DUF2786 domain-containing protein n=1 Tax=Tomitella cavernea TaxID=1387982 RepID=A0ABP9CHS2_9ACTN|nr:DUF2786 domain-containing protein [Tomitella cavernea]